jgi:hypothetical protein
MDFRRGATTKKLLTIEWVHPVWKAPEQPKTADQGHTRAAPIEQALPLEKAYEFVADGDRRPLLILRECDRCKGTDHALLSRSLDNEQTVLLTRWFRCIKLPTNVLEEKHPFFNLFKRDKDGDKVPHLFFADPNGANKRALPGDQAQSELWDVMFGYLDRCYAEDAKEAIKELREVLGQFDVLDGKEITVKNRIDTEIEKRGPESPKLKELDGDLKKIAKERTKLQAREKELRDLALRPPAPSAAQSTEPAAAGAGAGK